MTKKERGDFDALVLLNDARLRGINLEPRILNVDRRTFAMDAPNALRRVEKLIRKERAA
jgi:hypothetical protein